MESVSVLATPRPNVVCVNALSVIHVLPRACCGGFRAEDRRRDVRTEIAEMPWRGHQSPRYGTTPRRPVAPAATARTSHDGILLRLRGQNPGSPGGHHLDTAWLRHPTASIAPGL
jgi:hypothetical protein